MAKQFPIVYFKGIQTKTSDLLMAEDELKEVLNVDLSKYGIIQKRAGYSQRGDVIASDKEVLGLFQYYNTGGDSQLVVGMNSTDDSTLIIRARETQNFNIDVTELAGFEDCRLDAENFIDYLFIVGYDSADDVFIDTGCWNGSAWSTATNLTDAPNGKFIILVNGYLLIINGEDENSNRAPSRVWWPDPPTSLPVTLTWDNDNNWWDFFPDNGEEITGAISNFNKGLIFKNSSIHAFDPVAQTSQVISANIGCDSHRSIQNVNKYTIFYNRKGIYATNGLDLQLISNPVEKYIDAIDQDEIGNVCAGVKENKYYHLFIGDVTVDSTDYTNCELVYDTVQNSWTVNTLNDVIRIYCNYIQPVNTTTTSTTSSSTISVSSSSSSSSSSSISSSSSSSSSISVSSSSSSSSSTSQSTSSSSVSSSSSSSSSSISSSSTSSSSSSSISSSSTSST